MFGQDKTSAFGAKDGRGYRVPRIVWFFSKKVTDLHETTSIPYCPLWNEIQDILVTKSASPLDYRTKNIQVGLNKR
jgi:hypothetical protein